jgi:Ricin-type beta-trefoil lectin domain
VIRKTSLFAALTGAALLTAGTAAATTKPAVPPSPHFIVNGWKPGCAVEAGHAACMVLVDQGVDEPFITGTSPSKAPLGYGPADLQSAYSLPTSTTTATVAIVDAYGDPDAESDLANYRAQYGLPACTTGNGCFKQVGQTGGAPPAKTDPAGGWEVEQALDVDMVSAICPTCHILLVEADSNSADDLGTAVNEAVTLGAKYVSNSYGGPEFSGETADDSAYYNHPGVVITAAAGDNGYGVAYPAVSPDVVSVGGTSLTYTGTGTRPWSEKVWSGSGSGCSAYEAKPPWQADTGCPNRTDNDVAAVGDPNTPVAIYDTFPDDYDVVGWGEVGGTSAASPIIASVFALAGTPSAGSYPASYIYADNNAGNINDVTSGSDGSCSPAYLCTGETGYDGPTGWGTPQTASAFAAPGIRPFGFVKATDLKSPQLVLDDRSGVRANGAIAQVWEEAGLHGSNGVLANQTWQVDSLGSGNVAIQLSGTSLCLDVTGDGTANGTKLELWTCGASGYKDQTWQPLSGGQLKANRASTVSGRTMVLDDPGAKGNGTQLQIWQSNGQKQQFWKLP